MTTYWDKTIEQIEWQKPFRAMTPEVQSWAKALFADLQAELGKAIKANTHAEAEAHRIEVLSKTMEQCGVAMYTDGKITIARPSK